MLTKFPFYAGIAVDDIGRAKQFYGDTLGVFDMAEIDRFLHSLRAAKGFAVLLDERPGHVPAQHTVLNFPVDDIESRSTRSTAPA